MGCLFFFEEEVTLDNEPRVRCAPSKVEVLDNHAVPEIAIYPLGESSDAVRATFHDWKQFERFVEAVNDLRQRLSGIPRKE